MQSVRIWEIIVSLGKHGFEMNSADYHDEMNSEHVTEWLMDTFLLGLDRPTVMILYRQCIIP